MRIRITHIDGKLPNMALMRLSAYHKSIGNEVIFVRGKDIRQDRMVDHDGEDIGRTIFDGSYDAVYGSSIFSFSQKSIERLGNDFPDAIIGGTGTWDFRTLESIGVPVDFDALDYSIYPDFSASIGFSQRGCRLRCAFCVVPRKEGKMKNEASIANIWRGGDYPKHIHLLDNDFFGQPDWAAKCDEIINGGFKVCFSQGINIRLFDEEQAKVLAGIDYRSSDFKQRMLYTAWDNLKDEHRFYKGISILRDAGIKASYIMAYMLVGYRKDETLEEVLYRIERMKEWGIHPYVMIYQAPGVTPSRELRRVRRWVRSGVYRKSSFKDWEG